MRNQIASFLAFLLLTLGACQEPKIKADETTIKGASDTLKMTPKLTNENNLDALETIYLKYINSQLLSYLKKEHPNWSIPSQYMWYPNLFNKYKTDSSLVNYISGDFNCNGRQDYALIVNTGNNLFSAVAFLDDSNSFKTEVLTELRPREGEKFDFTFKLYEPGRYNISDPDLRSTDFNYVNLKCPGVGIGAFKELYEGGNEVFYWDKDKLRSCLIED